MKKPTSREQYKEGTSLASQLPSSTSVWICMSRITVLLMFPTERRAWVVVLRKLNQREHQICLQPRLNGCPQCTERSICPLSYWNIVREGNGVLREKRRTEFASDRYFINEKNRSLGLGKILAPYLHLTTFVWICPSDQCCFRRNIHSPTFTRNGMGGTCSNCRWIQKVVSFDAGSGNENELL